MPDVKDPLLSVRAFTDESTLPAPPRLTPQTHSRPNFKLLWWGNRENANHALPWLRAWAKTVFYVVWTAGHRKGWARLATSWGLFFCVGTDKLYMNYSGFATTEHGLASSIFEFMLQTLPATWNKLAVKMLKVPGSQWVLFSLDKFTLSRFQLQACFWKVGFHFLETLECCRAETKQKPIKIMKLETGAYFTAHWTMSKRCKLGKNKRVQSAYIVKPMFSWDLEKNQKPNNEWQFPSHSKAII